MAQAPQQPGGNGAAHFVRQVVADPKNVPDVMLLTGYLGASSEEAHERLYLSPDLANYVEIPKGVILHQAPLPKEQDAHGGVTLWVKKDAALQYKMAPAAQALANYFAGAIQAGAAGPAPRPQPTPPLTIQGCTVAPALCPVTVVGPLCTQGNTCGIDCSVVCPTQHVTCPAGCGVDSFVLCPTHRLPCPTQHVTCPAGCGVDSFVLCPTHRLPCPTQHVTCPAGCGVDSFVLCPTHRLPCPTHPPQATCLPNCTQRTPCPGVSCGIDCTVVGPACQSVHVGTCFLQCNPTRFQPQCPFPTEVTCVPVCAASPAPACGPNVTIGGCSAGCFPGQRPQFAAAAPPQSLGGCGQPTLADTGCDTFNACGQTLADPGCAVSGACSFDGCGQPTLADPGCSFFDQCASQFGSCDPICFPTALCPPTPNCPTANCTFGCPPSVFGTCLPAATCAPNCTQICTFGVTCNPGCHPTNPAVCQIASAACPVASAACPQPSVACGGLPGQPVPQRAVSAANCTMAFCTQVAIVCQPTRATPCWM